MNDELPESVTLPPRIASVDGPVPLPVSDVVSSPACVNGTSQASVAPGFAIKCGDVICWLAIASSPPSTVAQPSAAVPVSRSVPAALFISVGSPLMAPGKMFGPAGATSTCALFAGRERAGSRQAVHDDARAVRGHRTHHVERFRRRQTESALHRDVEDGARVDGDRARLELTVVACRVQRQLR